jgi:polyisoprenoid-binding protein YceI
MWNALWALLLAASLPAGTTLDAVTGQNTIRFTIVHKLHHVEGVSREVEARAAVKEDGQVLAMVRVPVASFRTGDANRDGHMLEALEAGKFQFVIVKGIVRLGASRELPSKPVPMQGEVELHGVSTPITVPLSLTAQPDGSVRARGGFDVSLDAHHVERPSLLFVKIDDGCHIEFDLVLKGGR